MFYKLLIRMKIVKIFNCLYFQWRILLKFGALITLLCWILWTYRQQVIPIVNFVTSYQYRQCEYRRRQYEIEEKTSPLYVTVAYHGRLGNWLYSYASLLGIAKANGYIPYLTSTHPLMNIFNLTKIQPTHAECLYTMYDNMPCAYDSQFMNLPPGNISIEGYIQSWKYFRFMESEVRKEFQLRHHVHVEAKQDFKSYVGSYVQDNRPIIGIHIRRGNFLSNDARKLGFCHAPISYIENAIKYMLRLYPDAVFLVASDDISWCINNIHPPKLSEVFDSEESLQKATKGSQIKTVQDKVPIIFSKSRDSWSDFSILTLCNHSIITVGTFGWWAAWLANGDVVYYKDYPLPGTKLDYEMKKEDFYPEHWVALSGSLMVMSFNHVFIFIMALSVRLLFSSRIYCCYFLL